MKLEGVMAVKEIKVGARIEIDIVLEWYYVEAKDGPRDPDLLTMADVEMRIKAFGRVSKTLERTTCWGSVQTYT